MQRLPWYRLPFERPAGERVLFHNLWLRRHLNARVEQLLPRLARVDACLLDISEHRPAAAIQWRLLKRASRFRHSLIFGVGGRRYRWMLTAEPDQIPHFSGLGVAADVDDPTFSPEEVVLLNRPNVRAVVVTAERAGRRLEQIGLRAPWYVVPQGVDLSTLDTGVTQAAVERYRRDEDVVVGFVGSWLLTAGDRRGANPLWNVDHLLELWDEIRARLPRARLWLMGTPSRKVVERCRGRADILLLGYVPRPLVLPHIAAFDIALYPRERDQGVASMKVAEYMGAGVPTVSYDYEVTEVLSQTGAGLHVTSAREFVAAVERLARDPAERERYAAAARAAAAGIDWSILARRYEDEILDRHLQDGAPGDGRPR